MARQINSAFYHQAAWKKVRDNYIKSVGGLCEDCLAKGIYTPATCVHHVEELTELTVTNPEKAYGYENLMALCDRCHNIRHGRSRDKRYRVHQDGEVEIV